MATPSQKPVYSYHNATVIDRLSFLSNEGLRAERATFLQLVLIIKEKLSILL